MDGIIQLLILPAGFSFLGFVLQQMLCESKIGLVWKLIPTFILLSCVTACIYICWMLNQTDETLSFVLTFVVGIASIGMLAGDTAAWMRYIIVRNIQK